MIDHSQVAPDGTCCSPQSSDPAMPAGIRSTHQLEGVDSAMHTSVSAFQGSGERVAPEGGRRCRNPHKSLEDREVMALDDPTLKTKTAQWHLH